MFLKIVKSRERLKCITKSDELDLFNFLLFKRCFYIFNMELSLFKILKPIKQQKQFIKNVVYSNDGHLFTGFFNKNKKCIFVKTVSIII